MPREDRKRIVSGEIKQAPISLRGLRVGIVGGGLSGLACALALQKNDKDSIIDTITVFERDDVFSDRRQGFGLTLTNNNKGPLAELGLLDECIERNCPSTCHYVFSPKGDVIGYYGRAFKSSTEQKYDSSKAGNLRIPRQLLRQLLLNKLNWERVLWGHRLQGYSEIGDEIVLDFGDKGQSTVDVLVGADGFNSVVRRLRDEKRGDTSAAPAYLGVCVVLGLSTIEHSLVEERGYYVLDGTHRLFVMPFQAPNKDLNLPRLTMWQLSFAEPNENKASLFKSLTPLQMLQLSLDKTADWFVAVGDMLRSTDLTEVWGTALYDRPPMTLRSKSEANVVVIGDACHPMSMFKGQGANQAISDGPLLASWLLRPGLSSHNISTRLRCFEQEMISKTSPKVSASREAATHLHSEACLSEIIGIEGFSSIAAAGIVSHLKHESNSAALCGKDLDEIIRAVALTLGQQ